MALVMNDIFEKIEESLGELISKYDIEARVSRYNIKYLEALAIMKAIYDALSIKTICGNDKSALLGELEYYTDCVSLPQYDEGLSGIRRRVEKIHFIRCELCNQNYCNCCPCETKKESPDKVLFCKNFESVLSDSDISIKKLQLDIKFLEEYLEDKEFVSKFIVDVLERTLKIYNEFFKHSAEYIEKQGIKSTLDEIIDEKKQELKESLDN